MASEKYKRYLKSQEWRELAERRLRIDKYKCCACGAAGTRANPLECHHTNYRRIGKEDVFSDVFTLCRSCHKLIHRAMDRVVGYDEHGDPLRGWSSTLRSYLSVSQIAGEMGYTEIRDE